MLLQKYMHCKELSKECTQLPQIRGMILDLNIFSSRCAVMPSRPARPNPFSSHPSTGIWTSGRKNGLTPTVPHSSAKGTRRTQEIGGVYNVAFSTVSTSNSTRKQAVRMKNTYLGDPRDSRSRARWPLQSQKCEPRLLDRQSPTC